MDKDARSKPSTGKEAPKMITSACALGQHITGADIWLAGCVVCFLLACVLSFAARPNRGKNLLRTAAGLVISAVLCDILWLLIYFPGGEYANPGLAAAGWLLLYPLCLAAGGAAVFCVNKAKT